MVDLFHGQLKSKVTCRQCHHESVRFDPFNVLSLPLPMENFTHMEITRELAAEVRYWLDRLQSRGVRGRPRVLGLVMDNLLSLYIGQVIFHLGASMNILKFHLAQGLDLRFLTEV